MVRGPGPAADDPEPEGGRAAARLRQVLAARFGEGEAPPVAPDEDQPPEWQQDDGSGEPGCPPGQ